MARIRKTAKIPAILKRTNECLLHSTCSADVRRGMASVLEAILMDSGLYAGYGYITKSTLEGVGLKDEKPGVIYLSHNPDASPSYEGGRALWEGIEITCGEYFNELAAAKTAGRKPWATQSFPDESRRHYYVHSFIHSDTRKLELDGDVIPTS